MGAQRVSASALTRGANDSIVCAFAFVRLDACESCDDAYKGGLYLAIFQDKTEASSNRLERAKGIRREVI